MKVATAVYTLASVAVLALMIMRPPVEVSSPPAATATSAPAPEAAAPAAMPVTMPSAPAADTAAPTAPATTVAPAPIAAPMTESAPTAPVAAPAPVAMPTTEPAPATAPVVAPAPVSAPAAPTQEAAPVTMPPTQPIETTPTPSGQAAPEEKKNDVASTAAAKPAPEASVPPDYAREQRIAAEISSAIKDGEVVTLNDGTQSFMGILTPTEQPRGAVIILHGCGTNPDAADVVRPLRLGLANKGWATLSLQMPVLAPEAKYSDYIPLFANADKRIDAGIALLKQKGISPVVLAAHSCGAHMAMHWVGNKGDSDIIAYVGMGMGPTDDQQNKLQAFPLDKMKVATLDVYGEKDFPQVISLAPERQTLIQKTGNPHSKQMVLPAADHYFKDKGDALNAVIATWLNSLPL